MAYLTCPDCGFKPLYFYLTEHVIYRGVPELKGAQAKVEAYLADCREAFFELQCPACFWHAEVEILTWEQEGGRENLTFKPPKLAEAKLP